MKKLYIFLTVAIVTGILITIHTTLKKTNYTQQEKYQSMSAHQLLKNIDSITQKNIIFDFTGVVFHLNSKKMAKKIGWHKLLFYTLTHFKSPFRLKKILFDFLDAISEFEPHPRAQFKHVYLPDLVCEWLLGKISGDDVRNKIKTALKSDFKNGYFSSSLEKELIFHASETIFNPDVVLNVMDPLHESFALIKALHQKTDRNGNKVHNIYGLSNMDFNTFAHLKKRNHDIFDYFDGVVISADAGSLKPEAGIYQYLLDTYKLKPQDCLLIDDQVENIQMAEKLGFSVVNFVR